MYRIASNLALDYLRSRTCRQQRQTARLEQGLLEGRGGEAALRSDEPTAEGRLEQEEMAACLRGYVRNLPGTLRAALILRDMEGLVEKAAAQALGCSVGVVKVRTHRARKKLSERLREECSFYQDKRGVLEREPSESSEEERG